MKEQLQSIPNDKKDWLKTHTLTSEQRQMLIVKKLERATAQSKANAKTPVLV